MAAKKPLKGLELVDCAKANAAQGAETAAHLCGYGEDLDTFRGSLKQACQDIGVEFHELSDLITYQQSMIQEPGIEIAPDTPNEL
ncbi:hypothetical protein K9N68_32895 [Kovacikia minuta CCNUW1]|uniref:hypothetical protein n=1 Tax=Kovacikia minuta TaxID=2931930 RepID=UPI001CC978E7|nr:hypothetical protein [Kovacikia minuta]UBF26253.1 hypothetical protein K9N68_32895 [Kovacikia minuta CCNUW1]